MTSSRLTARHLISLLALLAAVSALSAGCGSDKSAASKSAVSPVKQGSLRAGEAVPRPKGHEVLAISGNIANTNVGKRLAFDIPTIDRMGVTSISLYEPFKKRRMQFKAIPLMNLLAVANVGAGAVKLHTVALNDYSVDIPVGIARGTGIYLATHKGDGSAIPISQGGPIRIVFLDGAKGADTQNYWNWSLDSVEVR